MSKHLHQFYEKTKNVHLGLTVALLFILIFMIAPLNLGYKKTKMGQFIIVGILAYILYLNFTETQRCALMEKNNIVKNEHDDGGLKDNIANNIILSYILSGFIMLLLVYVIYSIL